MGARFPPPPPAAVTRLLARFDRTELEGFIAVAIDLLDLVEDDPDAPDFRPRGDGFPGDPVDHEPAGDERDVTWTEQFSSTARSDGPTAFVVSDDQEDGGDMEAGGWAEFGTHFGLRAYDDDGDEDDGQEERMLRLAARNSAEG